MKTSSKKTLENLKGYALNFHKWDFVYNLPHYLSKQIVDRKTKWVSILRVLEVMCSVN
jgi:hypothetical protein